MEIKKTDEERVRLFRERMRKEKRRNEQGQRVLIRNLKKRCGALEELLVKINDHWEIEDVVYRLYHGSFKAKYAMDVTYQVLKELEGLYRYGWKKRSAEFKEIMEDGFNAKANPRRWIEAMFHARYFLEMAIKYSKEVDKPLEMLPSGYAALLYLYGLR